MYSINILKGRKKEREEGREEERRGVGKKEEREVREKQKAYWTFSPLAV